jgi:GT2 family glycosyltransferase
LKDSGGNGTESAIVALARTAMNLGLSALAANDKAAVLRWLERAHRLVPHDPNTTLVLASACLALDPVRAASLFRDILERHDVRQAWLGLAAAHLNLAEADQATRSLAAVLSRHAFAPDNLPLAEQIAGGPGSPGWCALRSDGTLEVHATTPERIRVLMDGKPVCGTTLPTGWERARTIDVRSGGRALLGSPIQIGAIRRLAGCVEVWEGGIRGWAWHPGDPNTSPVLTVTSASGRMEQTIIASDGSVTVPDTGPLAVPRSFHLKRDELHGEAGPIHVRGSNGKDLPGSPLDPFADEAAHVAAASRLGQDYPAGPMAQVTPQPRTSSPIATSPALRADGPVPAQPVGADGRKRAMTIVIPVHDGGDIVLACLGSVLAAVPTGARVLVVDDGSSDPAVVAALDDLVRRRKIRLIRHPAARGFPAAANAGIRASTGRDVILLNSDTLVPPGWLERLRAAAYASRDIGTVTPLSNDASILSYPGASGTNPQPDQAATTRLDRLAERANGASLIDIPVGVGFCLYLRRDCLDATGSFRANIFARGYGEENDFCLRARRLGWRNVALTGLFVGHHGGASFGGSAKHLRTRNGRIVEQLHPGHDALIARFVADDKLAEPRRRIDLLDWRERGRKWRQAVILITHKAGGGVEQRLRLSIEAHARTGHRSIILRPAETAGGEPAIAVQDGLADDLPNLVFAMPRELPVLLRLLRATKPDCIEAHHFADYPPAIYALVTQLGVPYDVHVHDYAWFCPRISLVGAYGRYCGEPDSHDCEACVADNGSFLKENIPVATLRNRSAAFLSAARRVVVPSDDTGLRMRRHFEGLSTVTVPHEEDAKIPLLPAAGTAERAKRQGAGHNRPSVCVVGSIGVHKGYDVLLACARDAARRDLDMEFIVVGHTIDDSRLMETGRVFVTGQFEPDEAVSLIAAQNARIGFVTSICPETWCLSLGDIWRAGLPAAAFDIGAPAERIRLTGRGFLLPLALSPSAINNALVAAMRTTGH